ncbi:uncharacterized protein LOC121731249 [Aricia agestis]|uniref:uncharacterized protein LOC121731249 n=1 Tax=Aricia agestis TaxID=91739 RepID=UPI001C205AB0|nr:uncharacterized protein LOC121731249 [Aricia agestis]
MQCFICVAYLMIICTAHPPSDREVSKPYQRRSLFHDVIESIRLRSRLPENLDQNDDNSLEPHFENYGFQNELLHLPSDSNFTPRRNDRIEMPPLKYRFPKNLKVNESKDDAAKEEIVLYVNTPSDINDAKPSTQKPKKQRPKPKPTNNRIATKNKEEESTEPPLVEDRPISNTMSGQSQIGNRDSQTVVKPTVIVNFRGSVNHRESEIRLERRKNENITKTVLPQNIFNINQEIKLEKMDEMGSTGGAGKAGASGKIKQHISFVPQRQTKADPRADEDMIMCETGWQDKNGASRKQDTVQILFSLK